jgi:putative N6-adenine-specific DNA methylase
MQLFAVTAPGLEALAEAELRAIGIANPRAEVGGVAFAGRLEHLYRANLWLRTASRVVVRMGEFHATAFRDLEREARLLPWERFVARGAPVRFRVTCRKSKLYHSDAVAERLVGALAHRLGAEPAVELLASDESGDEGEPQRETPGTGQLFTARFLHDRCTVSADGSGALLHLRGYRQAVGRAPLRETLAAALLLGAGWDGTTPLVDPLCGSGTIAIEGAMIARRMAPGARRGFAFMQWPGFDAALWESQLERARSGALDASPVAILASDRDAGATEATAANAERAGVAADVTIATQALSHAAPPDGGSVAGLVATNPPYGVRVGDQDRLRNLYAQLGKLLDSRFGGWRVALLSADRVLEGQVGITLGEALRTSNGGIPVKVVVGQVGRGDRSAADRGSRAADPSSSDAAHAG